MPALARHELRKQRESREQTPAILVIARVRSNQVQALGPLQITLPDVEQRQNIRSLARSAVAVEVP